MNNKTALYIYYKINPVTGERSIVTACDERTQQILQTVYPTMIPFICTDIKQLDKFNVIVQEFANQYNLTFELVKFSREETVKIFIPQEGKRSLLN